ncbi:putative auxin efflux carrier superfamily protein [Eutypa lata UCREL1]|uniref:Putative auxin efflux carrier superfamily protein n=1 Tax=Eutypa lata (strain UCR-EL1) TaxID=1287681 RepID=M7T2S0_EUTLA|nr:putative auxin efflux carrier superfamily protein [Eutypa lata UCREL1]
MESHESHPSFGRLIMLVFEAVMEVVCVSLPGYIIARGGYFDADKQKFLANLNVQLFTPCLIFTKLASQLNADKLIDLAVIPIIFIIQTAVSYFVSIGVSKAFRLGKRPANFVTAMGVFGNSNSLPISLVISLSQTLKGLHWDRIPGDNDEEVGARGILYLLIFQQLGQLVRWSWGYHVLLAPKSKYPEYQNETVEEGRYRDDPTLAPLLPGLDGYEGDEEGVGEAIDGVSVGSRSLDGSDVYEPAGRTPVAGTSTASPVESDEEAPTPKKRSLKYRNAINGANGPGPLPTPSGDPEEILSFPRMGEPEDTETPEGLKGCITRTKLGFANTLNTTKTKTVQLSGRMYRSLPRPVQTVLAGSWRVWLRVYNFLWEFMNPPLWAMLIAIIVASVPDLQRLFFEEGTFVNNSVTRAVTQSAGVAVPLILVVLGANLARNTQSHESHDPEEEQIGTRLLVASLISRMLLPTLIMAPVLALFAKFVPVSILDDPIFVIVCFLLTGAPSALQLAQICQLNEVYEGVMAKILFQSYVIWILPSTLILVMLALETVEWALQ